MADRARLAASAEQFVDVYLKAPEWRAKFDKLCKLWGDPGAEVAFSALRRIEVATIGDDQLKAMVRLQAEVALTGDLDHVVAVMTELVRDHAGEYLTAADLWRELRGKRYEPNLWRRGHGLAVKVDAANSRFRASREQTLIGGQLIVRTEAQQLRELVESHRIVLVDGAAGTGKSDVLLQFMRDLEDDRIPHLALRLDRVSPTRRPGDVGDELDLPASPVVTLAAHAKSALSVLVVDQLDIVSATSGRSPQFLDCVQQMITEAAATPNLRIVLSCRTFDRTNDARLRRVVAAGEATVLTVGTFTESQVLATTAALGFDGDRLSRAHKEILALPLHLALLAEIAPTLLAQSSELSIANANDLFRAFWDAKRDEIHQRLGRPPAWTQVLDVLVDYMSGHQLLRAPVDIADEWRPDLTELISSRVLNRDGDHVAFFHESFFDYVFARRFCARGYTIGDLLADDQDLFRRAQVRQVLAYNRDRTDEYLSDLKYLLTDAGVRFHLRDVVLAWLSQVAPNAAEVELLRPHLDDPSSPLHSRAWRTAAAPAWFADLDGLGYFETSLNSDDPVLIRRALTALVGGNGRFLDRALQLLTPRLDESDSWTPHVIWVLAHADLATHRAAFELLLRLVDSGALAAEVYTGELRYPTLSLATDNPHRANELLGHYLAQRMVAATAAGLPSPLEPGANLIPNRLALGDYVRTAATASASFLDHVWPTFLRLVEASLLDQREGRLRPDRIWAFRHLQGGSDSFVDELLGGAEVAFATCARDDPGRFAAVVDQVWATKSETIVAVLFEGFAANPQHFADDAVHALTAHTDWLDVGWSNGQAWGTRRLLEAVTPHAGDHALAELESALLACYPPYERTARGRYGHGFTQFTLLGGVAVERRTPAMEQRLAEWQRKFGCDDAPVPSGINGGFVRSPIVAEAAERMSDAQWRGAIERYAADEDIQFRGDGPPIGGIRQLASQLETNAQADPQRFARLAIELPDATDTRYFTSILRGVANSADWLSTELIEALIQRCHRLPNRPCGMDIARPLLHAEGPVSKVMAELIAWYANHPDPANDSALPQADTIDESLLYQGLNSVRGAITEVITHLIARDPRNVAPLAPAVARLVGDGNPGVRALAAQILLVWSRWDPNAALDALDRLTEDGPDHLLATRYVQQLVQSRIEVDFARLRSLVERMMYSELEEVQQHGAALATSAALVDDDATALAATCLEGAEPQRLGAARVYAANLATSPFRDQCAAALTRLFDDTSQAVRDAAAEVVGTFSGTQLNDFADVVVCLVESRAAAKRWNELLEAQAEATSAATDLALVICERALASFASDSGSPHYRRDDLLVQILMRIHTDATGAVRSRALDLIDDSLRQEIWAAERALILHDRGWQ
ncbi:hypothetical protein [Mycolicibacter virginiensis]|uniref:hypothetical protein n=1 Tax=Mycolicibacter virginiensis TaxID=1795032 RepID=UPI001F045B47|nr:hypothetical protein [Mycolicibacter virginiensis]ULP49667.1 hypothetical protein MJO54_11940 [Mycolicibacter virginiensis]